MKIARKAVPLATVLFLMLGNTLPMAGHLAFAAESARRPNIVFILADDLGYGDLGCYGQQRIKTPTIDRLAADGMRFTQAYAGCTVCAPSRCALLTGKHMGHAAVRGNQYTVLDNEPTIASVLKQAGYTTAVVGKWGMAMEKAPGPPQQQGFDYFCGYKTHVDAHNYYPEYLWENESRLPLVGNVVERGVATQKTVYAPDVLNEKALAFIEQNAAKPFFLYLCYTLPHANNEAKQAGMEVPSDAPYTKEAWPEQQRNHAAMITRLDGYVGRVLDKLRALNLESNTFVFFSSDNGPHKEGGGDPEFFNSSGELRGYKRALYEGGIRVPLIVRGPGVGLGPSKASDLPCAFWDMLPTIVELTGARMPEHLDGLSITPTLLGGLRPMIENAASVEQSSPYAQRLHDYLYWEFHENGFHQAIRRGDWKAVRHGPKKPLELYNLATDLHEEHDVAAQHADVVRQLEALMTAARVDNPKFPIKP